MHTFSDLVAGMDRDHLRRFLGIHRTTLNRWIDGTATPPPSAVMLLRAHLDGDLAPLFGDDWRGFAIRRGKLYAPFHLRPFDPFQLQAMFFEVQAARGYRRERDHLAREVAALREEVERLRAREWAAEKVRQFAA